MGKICAYCGKPTYNYYALCYDCLKLKDENKIIKCTNCGKWHNKEKECICKNQNITNENKINEKIKNNEETQTNNKCIICENKTLNNNPLCEDCYNIMLEYQKTLNKNNTCTENKDHYYNLKDSIFRMSNYNYIKTNCNKLIAIANTNFICYQDNTLKQRVYNDIKDLIERKKTKNNEKTNISNITIEKDERREEQRRTYDGHYVKSDKEAIIDNILFQAMIPHSYGQLISEIVDKPKFCDWFIPIINISKGIYIEYWGMDTEEYIKNKNEKITFYEKEKLPLIEIQKDENLNDQGFLNRLLREINKKAIEYYKMNTNY